jgi:hypothetical protein
MTAPNDDASQLTGLCFQYGEITNTAFICPSTVINNEDIARLSTLHGFEEDIDAAVVSGWEHTACDMSAIGHWANTYRSQPKRQAKPNTGVGYERSG